MNDIDDERNGSACHMALSSEMQKRVEEKVHTYYRGVANQNGAKKVLP